MSVNLAATPAVVSRSFLVSYKGRMPPFHTWNHGFDTVAVCSGYVNSIHVFTPMATSAWFTSEVISISWVTIHSMCGSTFLTMS